MLRSLDKQSSPFKTPPLHNKNSNKQYVACTGTNMLGDSVTPKRTLLEWDDIEVGGLNQTNEGDSAVVLPSMSALSDSAGTESNRGDEVALVSTTSQLTLSEPDFQSRFSRRDQCSASLPLNYFR